MNNKNYKDQLICDINEYPTKYGIEVKIIGKGLYELNGFYNSGTVTIDVNALTITSGYSTIDPIFLREDYQLIEQLANINLRWWLYSRYRDSYWETPDEKWIPVLKEFDLIKEETVIKYHPNLKY